MVLGLQITAAVELYFVPNQAPGWSIMVYGREIWRRFAQIGRL